MRKPLRSRATAIIEWQHEGQRGVLIHADGNGSYPDFAGWRHSQA